jgi:hypothetical protein
MNVTRRQQPELTGDFFMARRANPLDKIPSANCLRDRLAKVISEARQLGILLRTAESLEKASITPDELEGIDIDDLLPPDEETANG